MRPKIQVAKKKVKVPKRKWKSLDDVKEWARAELAGGPPKMKALIPAGFPEAGRPGEWKDIKNGIFEGQYILLESDPPGLLVEDLSTGIMKYVPSASRSGLQLGKTDTAEFQVSIETEKILRKFVSAENDSFNKNLKKESETAGRSTYDFYQHGRRISFFSQEHPTISKERIWKELTSWGEGKRGYGRQTHQDSTYFYEWIGDIEQDHQIFQMSSTRVQHILRGDRNDEVRNRLLNSIINGPLQDLSDDEFAWMLGQRKSNWPLDETRRNQFIEICNRIKGGKILEVDEQQDLRKILDELRE